VRRSRWTADLGSLDWFRRRTYVRIRWLSGNDNLNEERLASIEGGARERHTLLDSVVLELVDEVRRLRGIIAHMEEQ
jgi:hypothetical protein